MEWNVRLESLYCVWCDVLYSDDGGIVEYNELNYCKSINFILLTIIHCSSGIIIIFIFIIIISLSSSWIMIMFLIHFPIYILLFNGSSFRHRQTHTHHCTQTQSIQQRVSWALSIFLCRMNESGWMNWMGRRRLSGCMCLCDARSRIELKETELLEKRNRKNLIIHKNPGLCHESGLYPLSKSTHTLIYVSFLFFSIPLGRSLGAMGCEGNIKIIFLMFTKIPNEKWKIIKNIIISCF